jgi:hypothetical protein
MSTDSINPKALELLADYNYAWDEWQRCFIEAATAHETNEQYRKRAHGQVNWEELEEHGLILSSSPVPTEEDVEKGILWLRSHLERITAK